MAKEFVLACLHRERVGDATLFNALFKDKYIFVEEREQFLKWQGHFWGLDVRRKSALADAERVCKAYQDAWVEVLLPGGIVAKLHIRSESPLAIQTDNENLYITENGVQLSSCCFLPRPRFWDFTTRNGAPTKNLAQMYGLNALNFNIFSGCQFHDIGRASAFCAEFPKLTFPQLIRQRSRWARGYAETLIYNRDSALLLVLIHGIAYHILWILLWLMLVTLACVHSSFLRIIFGAFLLTFASKKFAFFRYLLLFALIFPLLHLIWLFAAALNLAKLIIRLHRR